jgi:hypothetical protein
MPTYARAVLLVTFASACGGTDGTVTAPTPTTPALTVTVLSGRITDRATGAPIAGGSVAASYPDVSRATTDNSGTYELMGHNALALPHDGNAIAWATADNYESDVRYVRSAAQDFRLYPIQRIAAGAATPVTVGPNDPLCNNNLSSPGWGADYVCRIVRIVVPVDGTLTVEAIPLAGGARPLLEIEAGWGQPGCCSERLENPTSIKVTAGTEVIAHVEIVSSSTTTQAFTLSTSIAPR